MNIDNAKQQGMTSNCATILPVVKSKGLRTKRTCTLEETRRLTGNHIGKTHHLTTTGE